MPWKSVDLYLRNFPCKLVELDLIPCKLASMEVDGSFHFWLKWKLQLLPSIAASTNICRGPWKLPRASIYPYILPYTSTSIINSQLLLQDSHKGPPASDTLPWAMMDVDLLPWKLVETSMKSDGSFHCRWEWNIPLLPSIAASKNKYSVEASMSFHIRLHSSTHFHEYHQLLPQDFRKGPCLGKIQAARGSLYSTRILCPILVPFPEHVWRQIFHHFPLSWALTPTTTTNYWGRWWYILTILPIPQPLHPFPEHVCRRQPARKRSS